jgi:hypothetical protein
MRSPISQLAIAAMFLGLVGLGTGLVGCTDAMTTGGGGDDGSGSGSDPAALAAADDSLAVEMDGSAQLAVLANDVGVVAGRTLTIIEMPEHGGATLGDDGVFTYHTTGDYIGADAAAYEITNPDGTTSNATIAIAVNCETCAVGTPVTLSWDPDTDPSVTGFRLYLGATDDFTMMTLVETIDDTQPGFDPTAPLVTYDAWTDLRLRLGDTACFRLTAYDATASLESAPSNAACEPVTGAPMSFAP